MEAPRWIAALGILAGIAGHVRADALRGKRLYLDAVRELGTPASCVDCHGALPGAAFGIEAAANHPSLIQEALDTIPQMAPLRGFVMAADTIDLAAYIGDPQVPSPDARVVTFGTDGMVAFPDRIAFGELDVGQASEPAIVELRNEGALAMMVTSAPALSGTDAAQWAITTTDCVAGVVLGAQQACRVSIVFAPIGAAGERTGRIAIAHDWVRGLAAVALFGTAREPLPPEMPPPPPEADGCATTRSGASSAWGTTVIAVIAIACRRRRAKAIACRRRPRRGAV